MRLLSLLLLTGCLVSCGTEAPALSTDVSSDTALDTAPGPDDAATDSSGDSSTDTGPAAWAACETNSQCALAMNSCCGVCGEPQLGDFDAINTRERAAHFDSVCDEVNPVCPECPVNNNPWLGATCGAGVCGGFDLRAESITACSSDDECVLRVAGCCECGGNVAPEALLSIRGDAIAEYTALVCDPEATCAGCETEYPGWVEPACNDEGRCYVYYLPD